MLRNLQYRTTGVSLPSHVLATVSRISKTTESIDSLAVVTMPGLPQGFSAFVNARQSHSLETVFVLLLDIF